MRIFERLRERSRSAPSNIEVHGIAQEYAASDHAELKFFADDRADARQASGAMVRTGG